MQWDILRELYPIGEGILVGKRVNLDTPSLKLHAFDLREDHVPNKGRYLLAQISFKCGTWQVLVIGVYLF